MKRDTDRPRRRRPGKDGDKRTLDRDTSYLNFLPEIGEGYTPGYQPTAGIVNERNARPDEWLENIARSILTGGQDAGYAIPDVLTGEHLLRRLFRMPHDAAIAQPLMIQWRAMIALLLLWDVWPKDDAQWPSLHLEDYAGDPAQEDAGAGGFRHSILNAMTPQRRSEGLRVFYLLRVRDGVVDRQPLCLLSSKTIIVPAANIRGLGDLLPWRVSWYRRDTGTFEDPCTFLSGDDRTRLIAQLKLLQHLNEDAALGSPLYAPGAHLMGLLDRFIHDLAACRDEWRRQVDAGDPDTLSALYLRSKAVYGLVRPDGTPMLPGLSRREEQYTAEDLGKNALIGQFIDVASIDAGLVDSHLRVLYDYDGIPFAREDPEYLLETAYHPREAEALEALAREIALVEQYSGRWNATLADRYDQAVERLRGRAVQSAVLGDHVAAWAQRHRALSQMGGRELTLEHPFKERLRILPVLLDTFIGMGDAQTVLSPFADRLLLMDGAQPPFADAAMAGACRVRGDGWADDGEPGDGGPGGGGGSKLYALPPLSQALAGWLQESAEADRTGAEGIETEYTGPPVFIAEAMTVSLARDGEPERPRHAAPTPQAAGSGTYTATVTLGIRRQVWDGTASVTNTLRLVTRYTAQEDGEAGEILRVNARQVPTVVCWPNINLPRSLWKAYYIYATTPALLDIWAYRDGTWVQGRTRTLTAPDGTVQYEWQLAQADRFPATVLVKVDGYVCGALLNSTPPYRMHHTQSVDIAIDMGEMATTLMLQRGAQRAPATLPPGLLGTLLTGVRPPDGWARETFIPPYGLVSRAGQASGGLLPANMAFTAVQPFSDDPRRWRHAPVDGHIYFPQHFGDIGRADSARLYYGLRWGAEDYQQQSARLFMQELLMMSMLIARLGGASSVAYRIALSGGVPLTQWVLYVQSMEELIAEMSARTGMPLAQDRPQLSHAPAGQAINAYARSVNAVNVHGCYLLVDIGARNARITLWLPGGETEAAGVAVRLGCRSMLSDLIFRYPDTFLGPLAQTEDDRLREDVLALLVSAAAREDPGAPAQKSRLLLDAFLAAHPQVLRWEPGGYLAAAALLGTSFLLYLGGLMLECAHRDGLLDAQQCAHVQLLLTGNGSRLLAPLDAQSLSKLEGFVLGWAAQDHPTQSCTIVRSAAPKQEIAIGLLQLDMPVAGDIQPAPRAPQGARVQAPQDVGEPVEAMLRFVRRFARDFPEQAQLLFSGRAMADGTMDEGFEKDIRAAVSNRFAQKRSDTYATYVACFHALLLMICAQEGEEYV